MSKVFRQHHGESQWPRPAETPYAENGTYGVVGGRGLVTPSYPIVLIYRSALAELRSAAGGLETVLLKVSGSKILYLSRFLRVMPLGCPLGCPREAPVLVWCLFPLGFYNIAQADCFFKRQEEEPILFGSSTGYSAFAYMLLNALFTMVDSASGLLYFTLAYMSIVILLFS